MFGTATKVAVATIGTTGLFIGAHKLGLLPGYFEAPPNNPLLKDGDANAMRYAQQDATQQRVNSCIAGIIIGGVATALVLAIWEK